MSHAMSHPFREVDPKRIFATAGAIAVHVLALMLLLAPIEWAPRKIVAIEEDSMTVVEQIERVKPIDPPPVPQPVTPPTPQAPTRPTVAPEAPPVVSNEQFAMAIPYTEPVIDLPPAQSFDPPSPGPVSLAMSVAPAPFYPGREARLGITGRVLLRVEVDAEGRPISVTIEKSSGNNALDRAAKETVMKKWRFVPAQRNGENVAAVGLVPIDFVLD